jgi:hypothetical protein
MYIDGFGMDDFKNVGNHPQFGIIKKHIERAVQDLFIDSLRTRTDDLLYVFNDESQIDAFTKRILNYWEELEDYEVCKEVLDLSKNFKERWKNRESVEESTSIARIKSLFKSQE